MIEEVVKALKKLDVILYPTDTVWGIGCDATSEEAVKKVYKLKKREESKSLIILVDSIEMLRKYVDDIPQKAIHILKERENPTTIIYNNPKKLASNTIAKDNTIAIRIVKNEFCQNLIKHFGKPIVSTSANISGEPTPKSFLEISKAILNNVDYVVNLYQNKESIKSSTILKIDGEDVIVIRE